MVTLQIYLGSNMFDCLPLSKYQECEINIHVIDLNILGYVQ